MADAEHGAAVALLLKRADGLRQGIIDCTDEIDRLQKEIESRQMHRRLNETAIAELERSIITLSTSMGKSEGE